MAWQDAVFAVGNVVLSIGLIFSITSAERLREEADAEFIAAGVDLTASRHDQHRDKSVPLGEAQGHLQQQRS